MGVGVRIDLTLRQLKAHHRKDPMSPHATSLATTLTGYPAPRAWNANWVWHSQAPHRNAWVLFRDEFEADDTSGAKLFISADTRYRIWINGVRLGDGPPQSQPYHQYYDEIDVGSHLTRGSNCIAVVVNHQGVQESTRGGFLAEIVDGEGRSLSASGKEWKTRVGTAWRKNTYFEGMNRIGPFQEHFDQRKNPRGWKKQGYNSSSWESPEVLGGRGSNRPPLVMPWCRMIPRDIKRLREGCIYPQKIQTLEECVDLANRRESGNLSISLSQVGRPLSWATFEGEKNLLKKPPKDPQEEPRIFAKCRV